MNPHDLHPRAEPLEQSVTGMSSAQRAVVRSARTDAGEIEPRWRPRDFERAAATCHDLRVGGSIRLVRAEEGALYPAWNSCREIVPERKPAYDRRCERSAHA